MKKYLNVALGVILVLLIYGCHPIDKSYSLSEAETEGRGLVMCSISWEVQDDEADQIITPNITVNPVVDKNDNFFAVYRKANDKPSGRILPIRIAEENKRISIFLQEWPAGAYKITPEVHTIQWKAFFEPIEVSVKPGKVTYAGSLFFKDLRYEKNILSRILLGDRIDKNCSFEVQDKAERDFALLRKNGPYIREEDIIREID